MQSRVSYIAALGLLRRLLAAALICAGAVLAGRAGAVAGGLVAAAGFAVYLLFRPRRRAPIRYAAGPAIFGPDLLGFLWLGLFVALPFWASGSGGSGGALHPSAYILWPMALPGVAFCAIGWRSESFGLTPGEAALDLTRGLRHWHLPYCEIRARRAWRRDLPGWMRALAPLLAGAHPTTAGALMLARPRRGVELLLCAGGHLVIETDALLPPGALDRALDRAGVPHEGARTRLPPAGRQRPDPATKTTP